MRSFLYCLVAFALAHEPAEPSEKMMEMFNDLLEKKLSGMNAQLDDLKRQLKEAKQENVETRRRLAKKIDTSVYKGVRVRAPNSMFALGPKDDIALLRMGNSKALLQADEVSTSGSFAVGGSLKLGQAKKACNAATEGHIQYKSKEILVCDGKAWAPIRVQRNEFLTPPGLLRSIDNLGNKVLGKSGRELFARDDVKYSLKADNSPVKVIDFSEGPASSNHPFTVVSEIEGRDDGKVRWNSGWNGNDAIRSHKAFLKGDFQFGCTVDGGGANRFGMGVMSKADASKFSNGNSCGGCDGMKHNYFCRFEQKFCMFNKRNTYVSNGWNEMHQDGTKFRMSRKSGKITAEMYRGSKRVKTYTWPTAFTDDMHLIVANDGGSSSSLKDCYYMQRRSLPARPFHKLKAATGDGTPLKGFKVVAGSLPKGMKLDGNSGVIYGQPNKVKKINHLDVHCGRSGYVPQFQNRCAPPQLCWNKEQELPGGANIYICGRDRRQE